MHSVQVLIHYEQMFRNESSLVSQSNLQRKCAHSPFRNVKLGDSVEAIGRNTVLLHVARPEKGPRDIKGVGI